MRSLADNEAGFLRHTLTTTIDGYQIVVAATLDIERDDCRIVDYDRPDVQTVRSYRSKTDATTLRNDDNKSVLIFQNVPHKNVIYFAISLIFSIFAAKNAIYGKIYHARPHCLEKQRG